MGSRNILNLAVLFSAFLFSSFQLFCQGFSVGGEDGIAASPSQALEEVVEDGKKKDRQEQSLGFSSSEKGEPRVMNPKEADFESFTIARNIPVEEKYSEKALQWLKERTPEAYHDHPEFGEIPFNTQCDGCVELIHERTKSRRKFVKVGEPSTIYIQKCRGDLHIKNEKGEWISLNTQLLPSENGPERYVADQQPVPTGIDLQTGYSFIEMADGQEFRFNKDLHYLHLDDEGKKLSRKAVDLSGTSVGADGALTKNAWPSIDREVVHRTSGIKTDFKIQSPLGLKDTSGYIVFEDQIRLEAGHRIVRDPVKGKEIENGIWQGNLLVADASGKELLRWESPAVYDRDRDHLKVSGYKVIEEGGEVKIRTYVDAGWLARKDRSYPVTVDPLVTGSNTYSAGQIGFTDFTDDGSGQCGNSTTSCDQIMNVSVPGESEITDVLWELDYYAECTTINCGLFCSHAVSQDHGGFLLEGPCGKSPTTAGNWWSCKTGCSNCGQCNGSTRSSPQLADCLGPQCSNYSIGFTVKNIHCNVCSEPSVSYGSCNTSYHYTINNSWMMTVEAQTVDTANPISSTNGTTICEGQSTQLEAYAEYGVPSYSYSWNSGAFTGKTLTVSPSSTTQYDVEITDACGRTAHDTVTIDVDPKPTVSAGNDSTICQGDDAFLDGSYGGSASNITWSTAGDGSFSSTTDPNATYTPGPTDESNGSVTLTITTDDPAGPCTAVSDNMTLTITPAPTVSAGSNATICEGDNYTLNGSFGGSSTGLSWSTSGDGSFSSSTDPSATYTPGPNDISNGSVTLTANSTGGCKTVSDNMTLTIDPGATVSAGSDATICEGNSYTLNGSYGGGASNITWSTGGDGSFSSTTDPNATYTPGPNDESSGSVTLTITTDDPAGPCPSVSDQMTLTIDPAATVSAGSDATICEGDSYTVNGSYGGGASNITWSTSGDGSFSSVTDPNATYAPGPNDESSGSVTLTITTDDPAGPCPSVSDQMTLTIDPAATVSAGSDASICKGDSYTLNGSFGGGASNITWSTGGDGSFSSATDPNATYTPGPNDESSGSVTLTITTDDPAGPCPSVSDQMTLAIDTLPVISFSGVGSPYCEDGPKDTLTGSEAPSGSFSGTGVTDLGSGEGSFDPSAVGPGTYDIYYSYTDGNGCSNTDTQTVDVNPLPTVSFSGSSASYCGNGSGDTLTGNQAPSGSFSGSGVTDLGSGKGYFDPTAVSAGTHDVYYSYTDAKGCSNVDTQSVTVNAPPVLDSSNVSITMATCGNSDGKIENLVVNGGTSPFTYEWRNASNTVVGNSIDLTGVPSGSYTVNVTDNNGCVDTLGSITISDIGGPTVDAGPDSTICQGDSLTIGGSPTANGGTSPYSYSWTNGSSLDNDSLANPKAGPSSTTIYTVTVTDDNGCNGSDQMTLSVDAPATVDAGADSSICADDTADLDGSYGGTASSVTWSSSGDGSFSSTSDPKANYLPGSNDTSSGNATLTLTTNDPSGPCPAVSDSMKLSFMAVPNPSLKDTLICPGDSIWLTASGGGSYTWSTGQSGNSIAVAPSSDSSYWVDVVAPNGCDASDSNTVNVETPKAVSAVNDSLTLEGGGSGDVDVLANDSGASFLVFRSELPEDGNINGPNNGIFTYYSDGNAERDSFSYRICEPVCKRYCDTGLVRIELEYEETEALFIPNGVSADGDGKNDVFQIRGLEQYPNNSLRIFNRWGELIYSDSPYENDWSGQGKTGEVLEGTYFYVLELEPGKKKTGYIEFVR